MDDAYDNLEEYICQSEPNARERGRIWQTAIGLQDVDGLTVSGYLLDTAKRNIDGRITVQDAARLIDSYYEGRSGHTAEDRTEEADKVASRIAELLSKDSFVFSVNQLLAIHGKLFAGIYEFAGKIRDFDISKREWVLGGKSVTYAGADMIRQTLEYDFAQERAFDYHGLSMDETVEHLAGFVAYLWQIHPFGEGNTRTTAVFAIKYLRTLGFQVNNDMFDRYSWYFRNALVRANYSNIEECVYEDRSFLVMFFRNLLLGEDNELRNRYLHIAYRTATLAADNGCNEPVRTEGDLVASGCDPDSDPVNVQSDPDSDPVNVQSDPDSDPVMCLLSVLGNREMSTAQLMSAMGFSHRTHFRRRYLKPALEQGLIEMTIPDTPNSRNQKYRRRR